MKSKLEKLAALVKMAVTGFTTIIPVSESEIMEALTAVEMEVNCLPYSNIDPSTVQAELQLGIGVLANLVYNLENGQLVHCRKNKRHLLLYTNALLKKISRYLDWYCQPVIPGLYEYKLLSANSLLKTLAHIQAALKEKLPATGLYPVIQPHISAVRSIKLLPYHRWLWWSQFAASTLISHIGNEQSLENILTALNFNTPEYTNWLSVKLENGLNGQIGIARKVEYIIAQLKRYDGLRYAAPFLPAHRSVSKSMHSILKMHFSLVKSAGGANTETAGTGVPKINTALSVPQLALLIRLLTDAKIINSHNHTQLLSSFAAIMYTAKTNRVSANSLRVDYYSPGSAAKNSIKDYLVTMLNLLKNY